MCLDGGAIPEHKRTQIQFPGAYKSLYEAGSFIGVMNQAYCGHGCDSDYVWVEDDLCLFWRRSSGEPFSEWIRLFPFRIDRSGEPGRLLKSVRSKRSYPWTHLLPRRWTRLPIKMYWYDV